MDITKELQPYIDNLVPTVKNAVLSSEWKKRVGEIGQKYSLGSDQILSLEYEVLFVIIGIEPREDLTLNIQNELGVSQIIAPQIEEEVDTRVFQYILKLIEPENTPQSSSENNVQGASIQHTSNTELLSHMEDMANKEGSAPYTAKKIEPPSNLPGQFEENITTYAPETEKPTQKPNFADTKLNTMVTSTDQTVVKDTSLPQMQKPVAHSYTSDPYREPLE